MNFNFSKFGQKLNQRDGIVELMDDLGKAMSTHPDMRMLGGGNPAAIPAMQEVFRRRFDEMSQDTQAFDKMLVNYDGPAGNPRFLSAVAECLSRETGAALRQQNIAVTSGGQTAFFFLFNLLAGEFADGSHKKILLPLAPEYIGYANQGIGTDLFIAQPALIEETGPHEFKYHVDFDNLQIGDDIAAICVSRPTNPSGNVLTDAELGRLSELAKAHDIPLIIDNAYGNPFPGAIFTEASPLWDEHIILTLSLSKLGLPGTRTGIVVANEKVIEAICAATAVIGLANNNIGQAITAPMLESGELIALSRDVVRPYYRERSERARRIAAEAFGDSTPYRIHVGEGAFFLWFWFEGLPITTRELYRRLKARDVLVVPGEYFFYGLENQWKHSEECIRVTFSQPEPVVREGLEIIADEVRRCYAM